MALDARARLADKSYPDEGAIFMTVHLPNHDSGKRSFGCRSSDVPTSKPRHV